MFEDLRLEVIRDNNHSKTGFKFDDKKAGWWAATGGQDGLCYSKVVSSGRDFQVLKLFNRQERFRQKKIPVIPSHFNNLKRNSQRPLFL